MRKRQKEIRKAHKRKAESHRDEQRGVTPSGAASTASGGAGGRGGSSGSANAARGERVADNTGGRSSQRERGSGGGRQSGGDGRG
jgi:hypothetical protein